MNFIAYKLKGNLYLLLIIIPCILFSCNEKNQSEKKLSEKSPLADSLAIRAAFSESAVLSPEESIEAMQVEEGFEVKLVASEPLVNTPVAINFDYRGRIWLVEMVAYMPDVEGDGEDLPIGKVVILEDVNGDGVMDERKVFLDSLLLPRAICLIDSGILIAEPPKLWFYEINDDKPGKRTLVDGEYAVDGNVEHQPNGLLRAMDNWIYNAKSDTRYRRKGGKWLKEHTHRRGQWGITQDNYGRLYYNDNSSNIKGDYFMPGLGRTNKNQQKVAGFSERVVADNRTYPIRPTPGVNRGYLEDFLDDSLRLVNLTAACGPVIYRGGLFGEAFNFNAFVAEPAANLIKRNILEEKGYKVEGRQAYEGKEFLASVDERFRPVNLYNGPDGALYIVDMYRGIIQHKTYLTPYLKREIQRRELSQPLSYGRIYKVVPVDKTSEIVRIPDDSEELVELLGHANGWVRDNAQQKLIDRRLTQAVPDLRNALGQKDKTLQAIHSLWVLEGLGALRTEDVISLLKDASWPIRMEALTVLPSVMDQTNYKQYVSVLREMVEKSDSLAMPYIAFAANHIRTFDSTIADNLLYEVVKKYPDNLFVADAVISNMEGREEVFQAKVKGIVKDPALTINRQIQKIIDNIKEVQANQNIGKLKREFPKGHALYTSICQTCHGIDGNGMASLAPPLNQSEWVTGDKNKLISIVLFGLSGPVKVNGHLYKAPEINGDMPGIGYDQDLSNEDIASLLSFVRKSWKNNADKINGEEVEKVRQQHKDREKPFTVEELNELY